ncbi:MAG: hypothetical protein V8T86_15160 [Victivallis sp.]
MNDKVDPYLRPLYDALGDMLGGVINLLPRIRRKRRSSSAAAFRW